MVRDLGIIKDALVRADPILLQHRVCIRAVTGHFGQHLHGLLHRGDVILRQSARIRSRISQHLVTFIQRLRKPQRVLRRKTKPRIRFALQAGQIIEQRRKLRGRLAFLGDDTRLAEALGADAFRLLAGPKTFRLEFAFRLFLINRLLA